MPMYRQYGTKTISWYYMNNLGIIALLKSALPWIFYVIKKGYIFGHMIHQIRDDIQNVLISTFFILFMYKITLECHTLKLVL